jgi:acetyl esterase/lipase
LDLATKAIDSLTESGVIYRYQVMPPSAPIPVLATYADATTPLALVRVDIEKRKAVPLVPRNAEGFHVGKYRVEEPQGLGPAWIFEPAVKPRAVVLFIHGGPDINVSPRWDPIVQLWLELGMVVVTPNYPGSRGFGYAYMNRGEEALSNLSAWVDWIKSQYGQQPLFVDGLSAGGRYTQKLLMKRPGDFQGGILRSTQLFIPTENISRLPPLVYQFGSHDPFVDREATQKTLDAWSRAAPGKIFFREYPNEGHLIRELASLEDSLAFVAAFMNRTLSGALTAPP